MADTTQIEITYDLKGSVNYKDIEDEDLRSEVMFEMTLTSDNDLLDRQKFLEFFLYLKNLNHKNNLY